MVNLYDKMRGRHTRLSRCRNTGIGGECLLFFTCDHKVSIIPCAGSVPNTSLKGVALSLDAIIVADYEVSSLSGSHPLKLSIDGETADIQTVYDYITHDRIKPAAAESKRTPSWASAPKLNGIYLLSFLQGKNFEVALIDNFFLEKERFRCLIKENPRAVIISTTFIHSKKVLRQLVEDIRTVAGDITVIVGGPFIYSSYLVWKRRNEPEYAFEEIKQDFVFQGQGEPAVDLYIISLKGEEVLSEALRLIHRGERIDDLPNTARLVGDSYRFSPRIDDLSDSKTFSIDWEALPSSLFESGVMPMQASTGCTFRCAFCNFVKDIRLTSVISLDQLVADLRTVAKRRIRYVWFVDDNFRLGKKDLNEVSRRFIDEDLGIRWMSFMRADALRGVDVDLLRRSGCSELQIGIESADAEILRSMNKVANPELYTEVIQKLLHAGINCSCYFIFGFPGETEETISRTIAFIRNLEPQNVGGVLSWSIYPFILAPLSPIYATDMREKYGLSGYGFEWQHRTMDAKQAQMLIVKAFHEIDHSGSIYRGDDQDLLSCLTPHQRKEFAVTRHRLAKLAMQQNLSKDQIMKAFSGILPARGSDNVTAGAVVRTEDNLPRRHHQ